MIVHQTCPICAAHEQEELTSARSSHDATPLVRCKSCRFIFRRPALTLPRTQHPEQEHSLLPPTADARLLHRLQVIQEAVMCGALLDICSDNGRFLALAQQRGWQVGGVAARIFDVPGAIFYPVLDEGLWPAGSFEAVTVWDAPAPLCHPTTLLRRIAHYCRVDGVLGVTIGNALTDKERTAPVDNLPSLHNFSLVALHRFLGRFGFRVERVERDAPGEYAGSTARKRAFSPSTRRTDDDTLIVIARYVP